MLIRTAGINDAKAMGRIHVLSWQNTYAGILPTQYLTTLNQKQREAYWLDVLVDTERATNTLVACDDDKSVCGFVSQGSARDAEFQGWREIYALYLHPDAQGVGIGKQLLSAAVAKAETRGDMGVYLWVIAANPTRYFYEAQGGLIISERYENIAGEQHRMLAYAWPFVPDMPEYANTQFSQQDS